MPYLKGNRILCILAPLFKMLEATLELTVPLIVADIIDIGIASNDKNYIINKCLILVLLGLTGLLLSITAQYFAAKASVNFVRNLKSAAFDKIQKLSYTQMDTLGTSSLITRMTSDMDSVQNGLNLTLRLLLRSPFVVIGACIMAFIVDVRTASVFAIVVPVLCIIIAAIMYITIPKNKVVRNQMDSALQSVRETLNGTRVIRAFNKEEYMKDEFVNTNSVLAINQITTGRISSLLNPLTYVTVNIGIAALIYKGGVQVNSGAMACGEIVAIYNYMSQILVELVKLANLIISITKSLACGNRISSLLSIPDDSVNKTDISPFGNAYIEFRNVSFAYKGSSENSLENVSFSVEKGQTIGIIGPTGAGKTTLINLLSGFYYPTEGYIFIDGKEIRQYAPDEIRKIITVAEQKPVVFSGTVKSNLLIGNPSATDEQIDKALKVAQADSFVNSRDNGIEAVTEFKGRNFSGGQKQRISLARAILKNSDILILDDTSSALDYYTDSKMRKAISESTDSTVFIVSQRTGSIKNADMIIVVDDGKTTTGSHDELLNCNELYREIYLSQFEVEHNE